MNTELLKYKNLKENLISINKDLTKANEKLEVLLKVLNNGFKSIYTTQNKYKIIKSNLDKINQKIEKKYIPEIEKNINKLI